jgi:hypothetical protein
MNPIPNSMSARDAAYVIHPLTNLRLHEQEASGYSLRVTASTFTTRRACEGDAVADSLLALRKVLARSKAKNSEL